MEMIARSYRAESKRSAPQIDPAPEQKREHNPLMSVWGKRRVTR
jgi:hypothetical protein